MSEKISDWLECPDCHKSHFNGLRCGHASLSVGEQQRREAEADARFKARRPIHIWFRELTRDDRVDDSTVYCDGCGASFTWSGSSEKLEQWEDAHFQHRKIK